MKHEILIEQKDFSVEIHKGCKPSDFQNHFITYENGRFLWYNDINYKGKQWEILKEILPQLTLNGTELENYCIQNGLQSEDEITLNQAILIAEHFNPDALVEILYWEDVITELKVGNNEN